MFEPYDHIEKVGTPATEGIFNGPCLVFPKIDGTNASVWLEDGTVCAGSRKRQLSLESDNQGFCAFAISDPGIGNYLLNNSTHRLYGEWLVPHSLKTYREEAWRQFYVFDVMDSETGQFLPFDQYAEECEAHGLNVIHPIARLERGTVSNVEELLSANTYLVKDGAGVGEGLVVKRYGFLNRYGREVWAKLVTNDFKEKHTREMDGRHVLGSETVEDKIVDEYLTKALVEKEYSKIVNEDGWESKMIPRLLNVVFYSLIAEECWTFLKEFKFPTIDFTRLKNLTFARVKDYVPEVFA